MIEVERNFDLKPGDKERLIKNATFLSKKKFTDIYYDNDTYDLTLKDYWLRQRDDKWQLKVPLNRESIEERKTDQYIEYEADKEILQVLGLDGNDLEGAVKKAGLKAFTNLTTERESWQKGEFHLDFDNVDFGYVTFEAELMVNGESDINEAEKKILALADEYNIPRHKGKGKVTEYLKKFNPEHYKALLIAGVVL